MPHAQHLQTQQHTLNCRLAQPAAAKLSRATARRLRQVHAMATAEMVQQKLCYADLVNYMKSGCKTRDKWRFGTEHEKLGYFPDSHRRLDYAAIETLLSNLCSRFGWVPILEDGNIIGATLDGQSVTLEPGGQFELSGAPVETLHMTCSEVNNHLYQVKTIAEEIGVCFLSVGFDPKWKFEDVPRMPKYRYKIMREYMPKVGTLGHDMMFRSTTIQVNIDFESEQDMVEKMRVGVAMQPVATALFANSPFKEGKPTGYLSWRSHVWTDVDADRCGILPFVFDKDFSFEHYVDYALTVPMYFVYRDGKYIEAAGQSFRDFMEGRLPALPGELPSLKDWEMHLTTIFPEVRLKRFIEMRGADGGPWRIICALSALWVGLLYDEQSQAAAVDLIKDWTLADHEYLREQAPKLALKAKFRDGTIQDLAKYMLKLAREGLQRRGKQEESFLLPLEEIAESGVTQAERLLDKYYNEWNEDIDKVYSPDNTY